MQPTTTAPPGGAGGQLEWDFLHVRALQCAARSFADRDAALLAAADAAARQVSRRFAAKVRSRAGRSQAPGQAGNLVACSFRWRGGRVGRGGRRAAAEISIAPRRHFDHHQHRTKTGARKDLARRTFFIFRWISCLRCGLIWGAASGALRDCGNGILAKFPPPGKAQRGANCGGQLPDLRSLLSRYKRLRRLLRSVLGNVDLFLTQTEADRRRLIDIGADENRTQVAGNLKFDVAPPPPPPIVASLRAAFDEAGSGNALAWPVLVCGSTLEDEEAPLLSAFHNILATYPKA